MALQYKVISGDSHLDIAANRWTPHVAAKWRDRAPSLVKLADGTEGFLVENRRIRSGSKTLPHRMRELMQEPGAPHPGTGTPERRVQEQDEDGVDAEILFTHTYMSYWRGISDDEAYEAVVHGYNEWLAEEYCAAAPDRLIATGLIPDTGLESAIAEMEHVARIGLKAVQLVSFPSGNGYPAPEDDRFWEAALAMKMPITAHTNGGSTRFYDTGPLFQYPKRGGRTGGDPVSVLLRFVGDQATGHLQMTMAGVFDRFPALRIYWGETQAGWIPHALAQIDDNWECNRFLAEQDYGLTAPAKPISSYMTENGLWGFLNDPVGVRLRHDVGIDTLLWGSDFAHSASAWPFSREVIEKSFAGVPDDERYRLLAGNAVDFFRLDVE